MRKKILYWTIGLLSVAFFTLWLFAQKPVPEKITYGMSFNTPYARELGLNWQETYDALIDDLQVRHLRLAAHWPMVEPLPNIYNFVELDYQIKRAEEVGATVILAVGRRLPRWPECHIPTWVDSLSLAEQRSAQQRYMEEIIRRYQNSPAVVMWQVENEPFLSMFAKEQCGELDVAYLDKEIALVRTLDPTRPILVTDSGNLGKWVGAYRRGDVFGTSVYVHFWNPELGQFRTVLPAWAYRVKDNFMQVFYGTKPTVLIELSAEPWLVEPVTAVPIDVQFTRMNLQTFEDILSYAEATRFETQYLWGAEWWYWLSLQGHPEMWERGRQLFLKDEE
ncbi:cellulase family glycosylhydrolase [Candidatus Kaiserbacteria bacterium]|nr:cellulase family glycosylhydrolase [Candidatus Kaiserbacteria bacterium]NCT01630.1 cellulase family glycosylhydrolase [Candidatus Parcubacteria bacterium]